jgi:hypothetical protein
MTHQPVPRRRRGTDENRYRPRDQWERDLVTELDRRADAVRDEETEDWS